MQVGVFVRAGGWFCLDWVLDFILFFSRFHAYAPLQSLVPFPCLSIQLFSLLPGLFFFFCLFAFSIIVLD
ncbi:hypothetical protein HDK64DRAFT_275444 [Phyllosticta capitalensis]